MVVADDVGSIIADYEHLIKRIFSFVVYCVLFRLFPTLCSNFTCFEFRFKSPLGLIVVATSIFLIYHPVVNRHMFPFFTVKLKMQRKVKKIAQYVHKINLFKKPAVLILCIQKSARCVCKLYVPTISNYVIRIAVTLAAEGRKYRFSILHVRCKMKDIILIFV